MRVREIVAYLDEQRKPAKSDAQGLAQWVDLGDAQQFLSASVQGDVPVYLVWPNLYVYSVFVREESLRGEFSEDVMDWNFGASSGWGYGWTNTEAGLEKAVFAALDATGSEILDGGEPAFFLREFHGVRSYPEINQKLAHLLCIHWVPERDAYCTIDENGDFLDVAVARRDDDWFLTCSVIRTQLDFYMFLNDAVLVRLFDVSRSLDWGLVRHGNRETLDYTDKDNEIFARHTVVRDDKGAPLGAWMRGFQLIRRGIDHEDAMKMLMGERKEWYETFLAHDFKHGELRECSCDPSQLGNYFVESDLPFATSPAFFRPEVLAKYKQDADKYRVRVDRVDCRAAWSLCYDINEEGQVHAYLCDLGRLPHSEQLYWKSFNEPPKAGISERAFKTDFLAEWDDSYDPLISLEQRLQVFPVAVVNNEQLQIWAPDQDSLNRLGYVVTGSRKEWEDQVLALAKLVVDGLSARHLKRLAKSLGCYEPSLSGKSLKLLEACLVSAVPAGETTEEILGPLHKLWNLRSGGGVAHSGTSAVPAEPSAGFRGLLAEVDHAIETLAEVIEAGYFQSHEE